jgi:hypothetical protein
MRKRERGIALSRAQHELAASTALRGGRPLVWRWSPGPELPAICQQPSLTLPHAASCRFDGIHVLTSPYGRWRVGTRWGASGGLVNGMQSCAARPLEARGRNPAYGISGRPSVPSW